MSIKRLLALIVGLSMFSAHAISPAHAENLNQKYGPSWNCGYITAGMPIYDDCKPCQDAGKDFWRDTETTGHCVPKEGDEVQDDTPAPSPTQKTPPKPARPPVQYTVRVCNNSKAATLYVVLATNDELADVMHFTVRGWYPVAKGVCQDLAVRSFGRFEQMVFALHAQAGNDYWPQKVWPSGDDWTEQDLIAHNDETPNICVNPQKAFQFYASPSNACPKANLRAFKIHWVEREEGKAMIVKVVSFQ